MTTTTSSTLRPGPEYEAHVRQGFSQSRLERLGVSIEEQIATGIFPGAVTMVLRNDECVHFEAYIKTQLVRYRWRAIRFFGSPR